MEGNGKKITTSYSLRIKITRHSEEKNNKNFRSKLG
jgi:hypothetical protein